jgi:hypothetical protein
MWQGIFAQAGRAHDLIPFGPRHGRSFPLFPFLSSLDGSARELTKAITTIGEARDNDDFRTGGGNSDPFWPMQTRATFETAITVLALAGEPLTMPNLQKFVLTAAASPDDLGSEAWQGKYQCECFTKAAARPKDAIGQGDFENAKDRWLSFWPGLNERTKTSIEANVTGITGVFCTGMVRALLSEAGDTALTPEVMDYGKWIFVDMSAGQYGTEGAFVLNAWRYATQKHVTHRDPATWATPIGIWADEAGKIINSADSFYLSESRKFGGFSVFLGQSMQQFHAALPGERGKAQAEVLLGCFATKIAHAIGDHATSTWLSNLLGNGLRYDPNVPAPKEEDGDVWNVITGRGGGGIGFNGHMGPLVEPRDFMHGLATGGPPLYAADAYVLRTGLPFSDGNSYLRVRFSQR